MMKDMGKDDNKSNMTSASSEISASSGTTNGSLYAQQSSNSTIQPKKKRNLPGHPDPEAEVIALSPKTLLATNRFICDICNKGFQREQNLQLHRRGHNLPWKLKQRSSKEIIRKKVYVCPEPTCVHHHPSRALGDLTGIKKHFCRKHGEKKWKCDKCSKRYAVQSDWKAHSRICGSREYKCECGTIFSRRDSFIAHRAFCDALAQESTKAITGMKPPLLLHHSQLGHAPSVKTEQNANLMRPKFPSWLASSPSSTLHHENPKPTTMLPLPPNNSFQVPSIGSYSHRHMPATALLQKASQIGATTTNATTSSDDILAAYMQQQVHVPAESTTLSMASSAVSGLLDIPSREQIVTGSFSHHHGLASSATNIAAVGGANNNETPASLIHDVLDDDGSVMMTTSVSSFEEALIISGMMNPIPMIRDHYNFQSGSVKDETRDFLGLGVFSQRDFFNNMSGLDHHLGSSSFGNQNQNQPP